MNNLAKKMISYIQSNIIMSWSNIHKCILVLVLAILIHLIWIMWKVYILITPTLWQGFVAQRFEMQSAPN